LAYQVLKSNRGLACPYPAGYGRGLFSGSAEPQWAVAFESMWKNGLIGKFSGK